jgi:tetratricopeptide (TPR) repeat protein
MPGAVFLSYASQDAEAARIICDSLRAAGVEVWFDLSELAGGDAWDSKIKRQIRDCTLFLPVISEQTQQRREGYFRLEWRLADERSRAIAQGVPFLIPVVIDRINERDALVPDSFLSVQWTRLTPGSVTPAFVNQVRALLNGEPLRQAAAAPPQPSQPVLPTRRPIPIVAGVAVVAVLLLGLLVWRLRSGPPASPGATHAEQTESTPAKGAFPRDPELKRAWALLNGSDTIPDDFELAETLAQKALARNAADPEAIIVMAYIQNSYLYRGFDRAPARRAAARHYSEEAAQLEPNNAYAQGAVGIYCYANEFNYMDRAEQALDLAISLDGTEPMFYRFRDDALFADPKVSSADAVGSAEATVRRFPHNALCHYELARHYRDLGRIHDMEGELDKCIAIEPIPNAVVWKTRVALMLRGNPDEMLAILNRLSGRSRTLERVAVGHFIAAMVTGKAQEGIDFLETLTETWVDDYDFVGPKTVLEAMLYDLQGRPKAAQACWNSALTLLRQRLATNVAPDDSSAELWCLHGLGRDEEARGLLPTYNQQLRRPFRIGFGSSWWFNPIPCNLLLGNKAMAMQLLREALAQDIRGTGKIVNARETDVSRDGYVTDFRQVLYQNLMLDPRMQPWRNDPDIKALLASTDSGGLNH